jgi:hypothetical protein
MLLLCCLVSHLHVSSSCSCSNRYDGGGSAAPSTALGSGGFSAGGGGRQDRFVNFAQIKEETAAGCPATMWVQTRAYITTIKMNNETGVLYPACPRPAEGSAQPGRTCQKKLRFDQNTNTW